MNLQALLRDARQQLTETLALPPEEARGEAHILLGAALGVTRAWMIANAEQTLTSDKAAQFQTLLQRRLRGEPVAYILGKREFFGLELRVAPGVLIPRPDTETLVEAALRQIPSDANLRILDLGTGSGAIALAIAAHRPHAAVTAVDQSDAALAIARFNMEQLGMKNVRLLQSDWFDALGEECFDLIVSNPPYIAAADPHLSQGDLRFEPASALASGDEGLDDIRRIAGSAPGHLMAGGWLLLEHGYDQAAGVADLLRTQGFGEIGHASDLAGITRVTFGRKP